MKRITVLMFLGAFSSLMAVPRTPTAGMPTEYPKTRVLDPGQYYAIPEGSSLREIVDPDEDLSVEELQVRYLRNKIKRLRKKRQILDAEIQRVQDHLGKVLGKK